MKVSKAFLRDAPELAKLGVQLANCTSRLTGLKLKTNPESRIRGFLKRRFKKGEDFFFKAVENGRIVGYVRITPKSDNPIFENNDYLALGDVVVDSGYRGKGVGSALLKAVFAFAKKKGKKIHVNAFSNNLRALEFYEKNGFKPYRKTLVK